MLANVIGSPVAAGLLAMDGVGGLHGWQVRAVPVGAEHIGRLDRLLVDAGAPKKAVANLVD
jgi:hypothetical protein